MNPALHMFRLWNCWALAFQFWEQSRSMKTGGGKWTFHNAEWQNLSSSVKTHERKFRGSKWKVLRAGNDGYLANNPPSMLVSGFPSAIIWDKVIQQKKKTFLFRTGLSQIMGQLKNKELISKLYLHYKLITKQHKWTKTKLIGNPHLKSVLKTQKHKAS